MARVPTKPISSYPKVDPTELPPLDEAGVAALAGPNPQDTAEPPAAPQMLPLVTLSFLKPETLSRTVTLEFPFRWDGQEITTITVKRLTAGELAASLDGDKSTGMWPVYAAMTGLPIGVLRGMIEDDVDAMLKAALDFFPRSLRAAPGGPASA